VRELDATPSWLTGVYLVPICIWWLAQLSTLTEPLSPPLAGFSMQVLQALFITQALSLCLFVPRGCAVSVAAALMPAWPILGMLGFAAGVSVTALAATEAVIAIAGLIVLMLATLVQKLFTGGEIRRLALSSLGLAAAILAWVSRTVWLQWVSP